MVLRGTTHGHGNRNEDKLIRGKVREVKRWKLIEGMGLFLLENHPTPYVHRRTSEYQTGRTPRPRTNYDSASPIHQSPFDLPGPHYFTPYSQRTSYIIGRSATSRSFPPTQGSEHTLTLFRYGNIPWDTDDTRHDMKVLGTPPRETQGAECDNTRRIFHRRVLLRFGDREKETKGIAIGTK